MIILGIDPGIATTGYGIIEQDRNGIKLIDYGCIKTEAKNDFSERLKKIHQELKKIIKNCKPSAVAVEDIFFAKNSKTAIKVAEARGVILLTVIQLDIPLYEFTPLQVKQGLTNYGQAPKRQLQKMVAKFLNLDKIPQPDDAADALAIAICASRIIKNNYAR
ncbi:MAG: crossover junction endodeoxyribonuclease RuvC [Parcubacteria group bacterium Athens1014_10]|nr:MAG: crossover junction endodeoxyribonuclease RuvC [Parcubacteria group bacterium Athens1014_10]TSD05445.1 MAG: crossover junction endodeoxyribonuclease RuvC [Parcubacteria group bacterium Athens0714_12]